MICRLKTILLFILQIDTLSGRAELLSMLGQHLADVHFTLVDSSWYMWISVDPLADKNIQNSPNMYCNGNPIMLVDPDGMAPSDDEAAAMAAYAYGDIDLSVNDENTRAFKEQLGDWEPIHTDVSLLTGYRAVLFSRAIEGTTEYAYAFAGTDLKSIADIGADVCQFCGNASRQYEMAIGFAKIFSAMLSGLELSFVGHSLGGRIGNSFGKSNGSNCNYI